jgi:2-phosphosulfolactate phosphatase
MHTDPSLQIDIVRGHHPPANPDGVTVVIDVIRAFTTACFAFRNQVKLIRPVATAEDAFILKRQFPDALLVGEIEALPIEGFDFGNSPWEISNADLAGRELIMRTTNGIAATLNARHSRQVLVAGLVNAEATATYLKKQGAERVVLVASHPTGDEDVACAEYMRGLLGGDGIPLEEAMARTRHAKAAQKFLDGQIPHLHHQDIDLAATSLGKDGLALGVRYEPRPLIYSLS